MWKFKPAKITRRRRKVNYNLSIYKNYRNCLECLWIKVDWGGMSGVCVLSLEKGPMEAFLEDSRGPSFRWRRWSFCTELLVVNGSLWCSCKCMTFLSDLLWRLWLWVLDCWECMHGISSLFIIVCLECRGIIHLQCARGKMGKIVSGDLGGSYWRLSRWSRESWTACDSERWCL